MKVEAQTLKAGDKINFSYDYDLPIETYTIKAVKTDGNTVALDIEGKPYIILHKTEEVQKVQSDTDGPTWMEGVALGQHRTAAFK